MNFSKSVLMTVVAVGALSVSACGKKKEDPKDVGAPAQPQAPQTQPQQQTGPIKPPAGAPQNGQGNGTQGQVDSGPAKRGGRTGGQAKNDNKGEVQQAPDIQTAKRITGAQNKDGLLYTGSADDDTLEVLKQIESQLPLAQQQNNKKLAQSVIGVELFQDLMTKEAFASIKIQDGAIVEVYSVMAPLSENALTKLSVVNSVQGVHSSGKAKVSGQMQCLDLDLNDKTCSNILLSLDLKKGSNVSSLKILVRDSMADLHFDLAESSGNPDFENMRDFLINSALDRETKNKIKQINMQAFEVMNGRSGFDLQMLGHNNEFLGFRGELLSPQAGSSLNIPVSITAPRLLSDVSGENQLKLNLSNVIKNARLVMNDGNGKVKLRMSARSRANYAADIFTVTFTRKTKAVINIGSSK